MFYEYHELSWPHRYTVVLQVLLGVIPIFSVHTELGACNAVNRVSAFIWLLDVGLTAVNSSRNPTRTNDGKHRHG